MNETRFVEPDPLADIGFQKFLVDQRVMTQAEGFETKNWIMKPTRRQAPLRSQLWSMLTENPGFIVPRRRSSTRLYGVAGPSQAYATYHVGLEIQGLIDEPGSLLVKTCGQGLGVTELKQADEDALNPLYLLWRDAGRFVSARLLAQRLVNDDSVSALESTLERYNKLPEKFEFKNGAEIQAADFRTRRYYRLKLDEEVEKKYMATQSPFLGAYNKPYQEWLHSVGIIKPSKNFEELQLKEGEGLSAKQKQIVDLMTENAGFVIPRDALGRIYYGKLSKNWKARLQGNMDIVRKKAKNPWDMYTFIEGGLGLGIEKIEIPASAFLPLFRLWQNEDRFVQFGDKPTNPSFTKHAAADVRKALELSPYIMGSLEGKQDYYILTERNNLVTEEEVAA